MSDTFDHEGDAWDSRMSCEDDDYDYVPGGRRIIECSRCGKGGLHWDSYGDRYVLVDSRHMIHKCPATQGTADDFEALP